MEGGEEKEREREGRKEGKKGRRGSSGEVGSYGRVYFESLAVITTGGGKNTLHTIRLRPWLAADKIHPSIFQPLFSHFDGGSGSTLHIIRKLR